MGCLLSLSLKPTTTTSTSAAFFVLCITLLCFLSTPSNADPDNPDPRLGDIATTTTTSPPHDEDTVDTAVKTTSFRPSIVVVVGVLTTLFTATFLLLLYAKHCKRGSFVVNSGGPPRAAALRKNSGIDRTVVESLPVFRFGSLMGHKDGLECAVCLTRFEPTEVLRLLPKCKHAFHVECVDTWLDAHSTCPLCRYRVDPEDILLIEDTRISHPQTPRTPINNNQNDVVIDIENDNNNNNNTDTRRVSGRHSSALERQPNSSSSSHDNTSSFRRSLDSWTWFRKKSETTATSTTTATATTAVGCIDRPRKDGLLLNDKTRLEHRIIVSSPRPSNGTSTGNNANGFNQRWSDVEASDLLYLHSEMIMSDNGVTRQRQQGESNGRSGSGRGVINERSVSEITGLSRFASRGSSNNSSTREQQQQQQQHRSQSQNQNRQQQQQRQLRLASRWVAWISSHHSRPPPSPSDRTTAASPTAVTPPRIPPPPPLPTVANG